MKVATFTAKCKENEGREGGQREGEKERREGGRRRKEGRKKEGRREQLKERSEGTKELTKGLLCVAFHRSFRILACVRVNPNPARFRSPG